jgi:hypothetical protein
MRFAATFLAEAHEVIARIMTWQNNWVNNNSPDGARTGTVVPM